MYINAVFSRKENSYDISKCSVDKIIELPQDKYRPFCNNMLQDQDFIKDNTDLMYVGPDGVSHCILVIGESGDDGYLVRSEGSGYARYSAFVPNARQIIGMETAYISLDKFTEQMRAAVDDIIKYVSAANDEYVHIKLSEYLERHKLGEEYKLLAGMMLSERNDLEYFCADDDTCSFRVKPQRPGSENENNREAVSQDMFDVISAKHTLFTHNETGGEAADFVNKEFAGIDFRKFGSSKLSFRHSVFRDCDLGGGIFDSCEFQYAVFEGCKMRSADFHGSDFSSSHIVDTDCTGSNFSNSFMVNTIISNSDMGGTNFTESDLSSAVFRNGCNMEKMVMDWNYCNFEIEDQDNAPSHPMGLT